MIVIKSETIDDDKIEENIKMVLDKGGISLPETIRLFTKFLRAYGFKEESIEAYIPSKENSNDN